MSKISATDKIKQLNPGNKSGVMPQALDMIKNLKQIQGNPKMFESVGKDLLSGLISHLLQTFKVDPQKILSELEKKAIEEQKKLLERLK